MFLEKNESEVHDESELEKNLGFLDYQDTTAGTEPIVFNLVFRTQSEFFNCNLAVKNRACSFGEKRH